MRRLFGLWLLAVLAFATACGASDDDGAADGGDADTDTDADGDGDAGPDGGDDACPNPTVSEATTGLDWLGCRAGQCLVEGACAWPTGEAVATGYDDALGLCPGGTRLAEIDELMGLLGNCEAIDLATNDTGFCDACPASAACGAIFTDVATLGDFDYEIMIWSATELNAGNAWSVNLKTGLVSAKSKGTNMTALCVAE